MKIIFLGSDDISNGFLDALLGVREHTVCAVITQPDRPSGRRLVITPSPVRAWMIRNEHPHLVLTPHKLNEPHIHETVEKLAPDIIVLVAHGQFLGKRLLSIPKYGALNIHLSLLPLLRGAAPIHRAILEGHTITGVTAMMMAPGMDDGQTLGFLTTPLHPHDTYETLSARLIELGRSLLLKTLRDIETGGATPVHQDHAKATYAPKVKKADWMLNWNLPAEALLRVIRAFHPKPGAIAYFPSAHPDTPPMLVKIFEAQSELSCGVSPGMILNLDAQGPLIACGDGSALRLTRLLPAGRPHPISGTDFVNGYRQFLPVGNSMVVPLAQ